MALHSSSGRQSGHKFLPRVMPGVNDCQGVGDENRVDFSGCDTGGMYGGVEVGGGGVDQFDVSPAGPFCSGAGPCEHGGAGVEPDDPAVRSDL